MIRFLKVFGMICLMFAGQFLFSQSEKELVLQTVQTFFDSLAQHDVAKAKGVLMPEGQFFSVREVDGKVTIVHNTHKAFFRSLGESKEAFREVMKNPEVKIRKRVAMVWAPYEFYRNNECSHDGVDVFSLIKTDEGWKIAGTIYTVEPR